MNEINSFIEEVIECQKSEEGVSQEKSFSIPSDIVLDGVDMIATVQAPA